ncbi:LSU ribosomal protein L18p (L5e), partial [uncultured Microcoleus sp.]
EAYSQRISPPQTPPGAAQGVRHLRTSQTSGISIGSAHLRPSNRRHGTAHFGCCVNPRSRIEVNSQFWWQLLRERASRSVDCQTLFQRWHSQSRIRSRRQPLSRSCQSPCRSSSRSRVRLL